MESEDSGEDDIKNDEKYDTNDNLSDIENEEESDAKIGEATDGGSDDECPTSKWGTGGCPAWVVPRDSQILTEKIKVKPHFAARISGNTEPFELLPILYATYSFWALGRALILLHVKIPRFSRKYP